MIYGAGAKRKAILAGGSMGARVAEEDFRAARDVFRRTWENHPGNDLEAIESAVRASLQAYEDIRSVPKSEIDPIYIELRKLETEKDPGSNHLTRLYLLGRGDGR